MKHLDYSYVRKVRKMERMQDRITKIKFYFKSKSGMECDCL